MLSILLTRIANGLFLQDLIFEDQFQHKKQKYFMIHESHHSMKHRKHKNKVKEHRKKWNQDFLSSTKKPRSQEVFEVNASTTIPLD